MLIIIVFEWRMNFPVSREQQQQQKSPQQTPGCLKRLLSSLRASTPVGSRAVCVLNNQTRKKGCEQLHPKGLGVNKGHIRKIGEWRMGVGRDNSEVERVIGRVCFPDSFQRKEICVVCCGAENTVQDQLMFFFIQQLLSLAHSF